MTTLLTFAFIALLPFHFGFELVGVDPDPVAGVSLSVPDMIMMTVGLFGVIGVVRQLARSRSSVLLPVLALWGFWLVVAASCALNSSVRGLMQVARLAAVPVVIDLAARQQNLQRFARLFVGVTSFSAIVTLTQRLLGDDIGLGVIGERSTPFLSLVPGYPTPTGLTGHPYHAGILHLAGLITMLVLASRRIEPLQRALPLTALLTFAAVQASSRMLLLGVVSALGVLLITVIAQSHERAVHAALFVVMMIPLIAWFSTHAESFDRSAGDAERSGQLVSTAGNGRGELIAQSIEIWKSSPIIGVGPGNYVQAQRDLGLKQLGPWPIVVHSFPLQVLSETGAVGVGGLVGALGVVLFSIRRRVLTGLVALAPLAPIALLDHAIWSFGFGLGILGLVIALSLSTEPPIEGTAP